MEILLTDEVAAYIKDLSGATEKAQISRYLDRQAQLGHRLKEPVSRSLGKGIHEIRPGPHWLLFVYHDGRIVVLHAFRKKTQRTPEREIRAALHKKEAWR